MTVFQTRICIYDADARNACAGGKVSSFRCGALLLWFLFLPCLALPRLPCLAPKLNSPCLFRPLLSTCTYLIPRTRVVDVNCIPYIASSGPCMLLRVESVVLNSKDKDTPTATPRNLPRTWSAPLPNPLALHRKNTYQQLLIWGTACLRG
jgi:hypothetical protein